MIEIDKIYWAAVDEDGSIKASHDSGLTICEDKETVESEIELWKWGNIKCKRVRIVEVNEEE